MNWREELENFEKSKSWKPATELLREIIDTSHNDVESYVRMIYLLHNILLEEDYPETEKEKIKELLKQYFEEANSKFCDNSEYLFFIGKILYIAEWYFGINDDFKPLQEKTAFKMQKKAFEKEPENILFEWAYRFSLNDQIAGYLAEQILLYEETKIKWLTSKGFPGCYILESLKRSKTKYAETPPS